MASEKNKKRFGCKPSTLDGTEHIYDVKESLPLPSKYSYSKYLPKVLNQGHESICVPCSCAAVINYRINLKKGKVEDNKIDLGQIYNARGDNYEGMEIKQALNFLRHNGVKTSKGNAKINEYARIKSLISLKYALVMNGPCIGALMVRNSLITEFWEGTYNEGGHAICVVGYNEKGFIIRNSWGTSYGKDGYSVIPYEKFDEFIELWTII